MDVVCYLRIILKVTGFRKNYILTFKKDTDKHL